MGSADGFGQFHKKPSQVFQTCQAVKIDGCKEITAVAVKCRGTPLSFLLLGPP